MIIDVYLFSLINGLAGKWEWLDKVGIFCAAYLGYVLFAILFILLIHDFRKSWRMVAEAILAAFFVRFVLVELFYQLHFRYRPFVKNAVHQLIPYDPLQTAFPSGHASFYFALSTIIFAYNKKIGTLFYLGSFLIVISRVFVGVHWPSDILAGAVLGICMGIILNYLFKRFHPLKFLEFINLI